MKAVGWSWLAIWFVLNIALTLSNKQILQNALKFSIVLTMLHMIASAVGVSFFFYFSHEPALRQQVERKHVIFSVLFTLNVLIGNVALRYASVMLVQIVRCAIPAVTAVLSALLLRQRFRLQELIGVACVTVFGTLSVATTIDIKVELLGLIAACSVCVVSALKTIGAGVLLRGARKLTPFALLTVLSPLAALQLSAEAYVAGEIQGAWNVLWSLDSYWTVALLVNLVCAFALNVANFYAAKNGVSPLMFTISGNVKHAVTIAIAALLFGTKVSLLQSVGIGATIASAIWYAMLTERPSVKQS